MGDERTIVDGSQALTTAVLQYLRGLALLGDLRTQVAVEIGSGEDSDLLTEVRLLLAEFGRGDRDEASLRSELSCLIPEAGPTTYPAYSEHCRVFSASATTVSRPTTVVGGTRLSREPA